MITLEDVRDQATISVREAGELLSIGRDAAYRAAANGELPVLRLGRTLRVPVPRLLGLLGVENASFAQVIGSATEPATATNGHVFAAKETPHRALPTGDRPASLPPGSAVMRRPEDDQRPTIAVSPRDTTNTATEAKVSSIRAAVDLCAECVTGVPTTQVAYRCGSCTAVLVAP